MKSEVAFVDRCFEECPDPARSSRAPMGPVRWWFGLVFLIMGVLAILDATGTIAWTETFDGWWPVAVVGWGVADMVADRRVTLGGTLIEAIGFTLLADEQGWPVEALLWAALFLLIGAALLLPASRRGHETADQDRSAAPAPQG